MTDTKRPEDAMIQQLSDEIAASKMPPEQVEEAVERVWQRLAHEVEAPFRSCQDFQNAIPALLADKLSEARALLVNDHTRECVPCRKALMVARSDAAASQPAVQRTQARKPLPAWLRVAAALLVAGSLSLFSWHTISNRMAERELWAAVGQVDGMLYLVNDSGNQELAEETKIKARQKLRTGKISGAFIELNDGSVIEMDERSQLSLSASRRGTTINLERGNIIVHAAPQHGGHLYVDTDECEVSVKGTIFAVAHGLKGSRVSVIEGAVEVSQSGRQELLEPGDQLTTDDRLSAVPVEQDIAWSRNAEKHVALLHELKRLNRDLEKAINVAEVRTSTRLLDLAPATTAIYAGIPNLTEGLVAAREVFEARLADSPLIAEWWQTHVVTNGVDQEIDELMDRLQPLGEAVGDEVVVAVPLNVIAAEGDPMILAVLDDPTGFRALLDSELERLATEAGDDLGLQVVDDPLLASPAENTLFLWIADDLFAASPSLDQLQSLALTLAGQLPNGFVGTPLHQRLTTAYAQGVEWLFGADLETLIRETALAEAAENDMDLALQLGLLDAETLVVERHSNGEITTTQAVIDFSQARRGMASWLAAPAPMGSLDFVSPNATLAAAVVAVDAAQMFDELVAALASVDGEAMVELDRFQSEYGFDLRQDLAATLGGEAAFAIDGPVIPTPSWKLVVEVYDPATLHFTIERAVEELNRNVVAEGHAPVTLSVSTVGGREYRTLTSGDGDGFGISYTVVDGYLVAGSSVALIEQAVSYRESGLTLSSDPSFQALLPVNEFSNCSALSYKNFSDLTSSIPAGALDGLSEEHLKLLAEGARPSLFCVYGLERQIRVSGSGGSLLGLGSLMSLPLALGDNDVLLDAVERSAEVSSQR